jgi:hypothetical protein
MAEIVRTVAQWWSRAESQPDSRRRQFDARVALNALEIVAREIPLYARHRAEHARQLESLGHTDDASLAAAIRRGDFDDELLRVAGVLMPSVRDKVDVRQPALARDRLNHSLLKTSEVAAQPLASQPPSTGMSAPVTNRASSESKNLQTRATSIGSPHRPSIEDAARWARRLGSFQDVFVISVRI